MITKYAVIFSDGRVEFTNLDDAQNYFNNNGGIKIETIIESEPNSTQKYLFEEIPTWRIKAIISLIGLKSQVDSIIQNLPEPNKTIAYNAWEHGNTIDRYSPIVTGIQQALGLSDNDVDNI